VHVTVVVPMGYGDAGRQETGKGPSTTSEALAEKLTGVNGPAAETGPMSAGTVTVGAVLSVTVISNDVLAGPAVSVVLHVTLVVPTGKRCGEDGTQVTGRSALFDGSVPVTVYETVAPPSSPALTD
jgi:hypothetical protein